MKQFDDLIGKKITAVYMNENHLKFDTDNGSFTYTVDGDCCSTSVFYDFYGLDKLLKNGVVKEVNEIALNTDDRMDAKDYDSSVSVYGYEIVTEHNSYGDQTAVFSFRNYSNGYYGGWLEKCSNREVLPKLTKDVSCTDS